MKKKKKKIVITLSLICLTACEQVDIKIPEAALKINVDIQTKSLITGNKLTDDSKIGTFLFTDGMSTYDKITYNNIKFTASETGTEQTWTSDSDVMLSKTNGTLYAYYPYSEEVDSISSIYISANSDNQTDYLWATPTSGLNNANATASLTMNHALTAIRLKITKDNYSGTGNVTSASIQSDALATHAILNATNGKLLNISGEGTVIEPQIRQFTLSSNEENIEFISIPVKDISKPILIKMTIDGQTFEATTPATKFPQGKIMEYRLNVKNEKISVTQMETATWNVRENHISL